jgi:hypothetical protein
MFLRTMAAVLALGALLGGCGGDYGYEGNPYEANERVSREPGGNQRNNSTILGDGGIFGAVFGGKRQQEGGTGIGVNVFLWRATLDTLSFVPLSSADPFGGVVITDWYAPPETPDERFKVNVYILGRELRTDSVRVAVFRQNRRDRAGEWLDSAVAATTGTNLENEILVRARQMRVAARNAASQ